MTEEEPPISGELQFTIPGPPVSQQSARIEKDKFAEFISKQVGDPGYLLSGDVRVEIEWYVHEQDRYESDAAPDVDNILKPLLDALCGPQGVLIDDCQVQAVDCRWIDSYDRSQQVEIRLRFLSDEWVSKDGLCFVQFGNGLCFPINRIRPPGAVLLIVERLNVMMASRNALLESGDNYHDAKYIMCIQRVFHRSRVGRFPVIEVDALRSQLEEEVAREPATAESEELNRLIAKVRSCQGRSDVH